MKKYILLFTLIFTLLLTGCGAADDNVMHQDGNLIVTNYSDYEITDTAITHLGETIAASAGAIKDTQICYFTIEASTGYAYTVSFTDINGNRQSRDFTDDFTEDAQILIAIRYADGAWTIDYDK